MSESRQVLELARGAVDRRGVVRLVEALGFEPTLEPLPAAALAAYGLDREDGIAGVIVGRSGMADALLLETQESGGLEAARLARTVRNRNPARMHLFVVAGPGYHVVVVGTFGLDDGFRHLALAPRRPKPSDLDALAEMVPGDGEAGLRLLVRHAAALERSRITDRFFRDFRARRDAVADGWTGLQADAARERGQLALLFLSRLTFLYFLQGRGALAGSDRYLVRLFARWAGERDARVPGTGTFYRARLVPLFFGALNRRPADRDAAARRLGDLPYLNGGLFERHALERRFPDLDLPDGVVRGCLDDLLERYRFTSREAGDGAGFGVDPEILGRVFEGLMAPDRRGDTGSFYTPAPVVDRVVRESVAAYVAGRCPGVPTRAITEGRPGPMPAASRYRVRRTLERVRVLDPACGSGAFLLGALHRLAAALDGVSEQPFDAIRRGIVARSLYGVDLLDDAALLCSLRLWLALSEGDDVVRPLPNLDRRIRQGDALVDPLDLGAPAPHARPLSDPDIRRALRALGPAGVRYLESGPGERERCRRAVLKAEAALARGWIAAVRRSSVRRLRSLRAQAADRDLFGDAPDSALDAARELPAVRRRIREIDDVDTALREEGALPFFSFGIHFADAVTGFDIVVSNPPWIRSHRWPDRLRALASRFEVCRSPGWAAATSLTGAPAGAGAQVDVALLFAERSLRLLAPGGILALLLPAKSMRALYGAAARRMLLRDLEFILIEDHALDQRSVFRADAFVSVLIGRRVMKEAPLPGASGKPGGRAGASGEPGGRTGAYRAPGAPTDSSRASASTRLPPSLAAARSVRVRLIRRGAEPLEYRVGQRDLPLFPGDPASPWLLAPPDVLSVFRAMQAAGPPLGRHDGLRVRRGVMTGANDVLVLTRVEPRLGGLCHVEASGHERARGEGRAAARSRRYRAVIETAGVRPLVRGTDVDAFRYEVGAHVVWDRGRAGEPGPMPRLQRYLERHRPRLERRSGWRPGRPLGAVFRLSAETLEPKVAWHDLSDTLRAVALPARVRLDGELRELVPLNTVYFLPIADADDALVLAGLLNSLPVRTLARAIAERAKDARFRFFAWTVSCLPLPRSWRSRPGAAVVRRLSGEAHEAGGIDAPGQERLDRAVARLYGLDTAQLDALGRFDRWLRGAGSPRAS